MGNLHHRCRALGRQAGEVVIDVAAMLVLTMIIAVEVVISQRHELRAYLSPKLLNLDAEIYQ